MTISSLKHHHIAPFQVKNEDLIELFSFYLHLAPTIKSSLAMDMSNEKLIEKWDSYISIFKNFSYRVYNEGYSGTKLEQKAATMGIGLSNSINRNVVGVICSRKQGVVDLVN